MNDKSMADQGSSKFLCFTTGFAAGITAGVAATLLLAPQSGERTRNLIGQKVKEGEDWVIDQAKEAENRIRDHHEDLLNRAHDVADVISRR